MKEKLLLYHLQKSLKRDFDTVISQVSISKKRIDLVCLKNKELTGIEVKSNVSEISDAIGQCLFYMDGLHRIFIALSEDELKKIKNEREILKNVGIGLISISADGYHIFLNAKKLNPNKKFVKLILDRINMLSKVPEIVEDYKALAHPIRFKIYLSVLEKKEVKLKEIASEINDSYPLIIKHIKILEKADLIKAKKIGKETILEMKSFPAEIGDAIKNRILNFLFQHPEGLSITDITKQLSIHYATVSKYLYVLEAEGKIIHRDIGMAKLFVVKK